MYLGLLVYFYKTRHSILCHFGVYRDRFLCFVQCCHYKWVNGVWKLEIYSLCLLGFHFTLFIWYKCAAKVLLIIFHLSLRRLVLITYKKWCYMNLTLRLAVNTVKRHHPRRKELYIHLVFFAKFLNKQFTVNDRLMRVNSINHHTSAVGLW